MDPASPPVHGSCVVGTQEVVGARCTRDDNRGNQSAGDGFQQYVENGVDKTANRPDVGWEVVILEGRGEGEQLGGVAGLEVSYYQSQYHKKDFRNQGKKSIYQKNPRE